MSSLPQNAKKVFQGVYFSVHQWDQMLYDGSTTTFEGVSTPDSVFVVAVKDGKICVLREEQPGMNPFLSLPGGVIEEEDALVGAKRELLEEAGLVSDDWELISSTQAGKRFYKTFYLYVAKNCKDIGRQGLDAGERIEVTYMEFDDYLKLAFDKSFRNIDQKYELLHAYYDKEKYNELHKLYFGH